MSIADIKNKKNNIYIEVLKGSKMFGILKNIFYIFKIKKDKYYILLKQDYNIDLLYYENFNIRYPSLEKIIEILDKINNTNLILEDIILDYKNFEYKNLKGYAFLTNKDLVKDIIIKWKLAKKKVEVIKNISSPTASYNLRKTQPHIIYIEEVIDAILYLINIINRKE